MTLTRLSICWLVAASALTALQAQEVRYGVQGHISLPMGDLKDAVDDKAGIGGGIHLTVDFGQGHLLRPRVDYTAFPDANVFSGMTNKVNDLSLGLDYLYLLEGRTGFYVTGGLSADRWKVQSDVSGLSYTNNTTKLGYALGAGYAFNENLSLEARFTATKFDTRAVSDQNANALKVGAQYRF